MLSLTAFPFAAARVSAHARAQHPGRSKASAPCAATSRAKRFAKRASSSGASNRETRRVRWGGDRTSSRALSRHDPKSFKSVTKPNSTDVTVPPLYSTCTRGAAVHDGWAGMQRILVKTTTQSNARRPNPFLFIYFSLSLFPSCLLLASLLRTSARQKEGLRGMKAPHQLIAAATVIDASGVFFTLLWYFVRSTAVACVVWRPPKPWMTLATLGFCMGCLSTIWGWW